MVLLPSLAKQARQQDQRATPPPVPPLVDRSEFASSEEYKAYMAARRKAQERLREFNRPLRRRGATQPLVDAVDKLRTRERRILWGCNVETGRKGAPIQDWVEPRRKLMEPAARHALAVEAAQRLPTLNSAAKLRAALQQQEEWSGVTLSQVRRAITAANAMDKPAFVECDRIQRRGIKKDISASRPSVYSALLERKRRARAPQVEARRLKQAEKKAQREAEVC